MSVDDLKVSVVRLIESFGYSKMTKKWPGLAPGVRLIEMSVTRELTVVRMRLPGQNVWTPATCLDSADPRSFLLKS